MLADLALKQAGDDLIGATVGRGLVIIYRDANRSGDDVRLYFATRRVVTIRRRLKGKTRI